MKTYLKQLLLGFILWVTYTLEVLWILIFLDHWLNLSWIDTTLEGNPFFSGVSWLFLFVVVTAFMTFVTKLVIIDDVS